VAVDTRVPFRVAGTLQDLGTAQGPSNSLVEGGIGVADWYPVGGGEAGHIVSDPADPEVVYAGEYLGYISRYDHRTRQVQNISAWPDNPSGWAAAQMRYRFQWTAPIAASPHDKTVLYHAAQVLFRSGDGGKSWTAISPDLTRNDPSRQQWSMCCSIKPSRRRATSTRRRSWSRAAFQPTAPCERHFNLKVSSKSTSPHSPSAQTMQP
jgi:hypothetical protein